MSSHFRYQPFYLQRIFASLHRTGDWVSSRVILGVVEKSTPGVSTRYQTPISSLSSLNA